MPRFLHVISSLLMITNASASADFSSLVKDVDVGAHASRSVSHVVLLPEDEVKNYQVIFSNLSDTHLEEFRRQTEVQAGALAASHARSMAKRNDNLIWWAKFHEGASGKLTAGGYVVVGLSAVVLIASTFLSPGCGNINWIQLGSELSAGLGGFLIWIGGKSSDAAKNLDVIIQDEIGKNQHLVSILDHETRERNKHPGMERRGSIKLAETVLRKRVPQRTEDDRETMTSAAVRGEELIPCDKTGSTAPGLEEVVVTGTKDKDKGDN